MRIALVTGGSRGIGKAICVKLAEKGMHVLVNYNANKEAALDTLSQIENARGTGELLQFNVSDKEAVKSAVEGWKQKNNGKYISVLINNAGIRNDSLLMWMEKNCWEDVISNNLNSFYYVIHPLIQDMLINRFGRIINVVSLSGIKGMPGQTNYSAAKGGVIAATKALAQEVGKKNVTVNAVAPGFIKTDMTKDMEENDYIKLIPVNRFGEPDEVGSLVSFLASDNAGYITGEVISINGGLYT
jgi:3-oxoacyl-[acyl-carrier protein] reductase